MYSWTNIDEIAYQLTETHPDADPTAVTFPKLRAMVEELEGFEPEPGQSVNEQILEAIQQAWIEEREDAAADAARQAENDADDEDDDEPGYTPNQPFR